MDLGNLARLGREERAIAVYTKGLKINAKFAVVYNNRAWSDFTKSKFAATAWLR